MEGKRVDLLLLSLIAPLSRTPMDKKSAKWMTDYSKGLDRTLERALMPWKNDPKYKQVTANRLKNTSRKKRKRIRYRNAGRGVKPGEIKVFGSGPELSHPIFKDANMSKD